MSYLAEIPRDNLVVKVETIPIIHTPTDNIVVRSRHGRVYMSIGKKVIELSTITAHKVGMAIIKSKLDYNELVVLEINKERFEFLWQVAKKVAGALLRKADDADDYQLGDIK